MSIQPSVIIWTIINFCILMLILRNLLFKPLLKVMHDREDKIKAGLEAKAKAEEKIAEMESARAEAMEKAESERRLKNEQIVEQARAKAMERLNAHKAKNLEIEKGLKQKIMDESDKECRLFEEAMPEIVTALADKMVLKG